MQQQIADRLLTLNQEFYQSFAESFSETRARIQPGVIKAIGDLPKGASVLDVGCGNGTLACTLHEYGHQGLYIGLDSSDQLLRLARERCTHPQATFFKRDIAENDWALGLTDPFDRIFAFAVIHHLPGELLRKEVFKTFHRLLAIEGQVTFSLWNFLASERLRDRILPWDLVDIDPQDLDQGDYLLDWRRGGYGLRYVHAFSEAELLELARKTGFDIINAYFSDGEGGKLGYYQVWRSMGMQGL
jgi:tRNA (uracil-5-)-methyltransferase TRM9